MSSTASPTIDELTGRVEAELRTVLESREMPLYRMMSYHLGWEDGSGQALADAHQPRPHGVACLKACLASGGDLEIGLPAAAAVELVNGFSQVHDDVQGGHPRRDDRDAVWWVWGPAQAINAGDGMHALARLAIFRLQDSGVPPAEAFRAVQLLDMASLELCEGRFRDLEAQERIDMTVDDYLQMAAGKTGALYGCAMKLGALTASADSGVQDAVGVCGEKLGVARQLRDDLREVWRADDDPPPEDLLNKKKLIPVVYALDKAKISEKRRLGDLYFKRVLEPNDAVTLRQILDEMGAKAYCEELADAYAGEARAAIDVPGISSEGRAAINTYADWLLAA